MLFLAAGAWDVGSGDDGHVGGGGFSHSPLKGLCIHTRMTAWPHPRGIPSGAISDLKIPESPWLEPAWEAEQKDGRILLDRGGVRIRLCAYSVHNVGCVLQ